MISRDEVARIAALAKLRLEPDELERMTGDLGRILEFVEQIGEVRDEIVPTEEGETPLREDVPVSPLGPDAVAANAPSFSRGHFVVPRVLGGEE